MVIGCCERFSTVHMCWEGGPLSYTSLFVGMDSVFSYTIKFVLM